MSDPSAQGHTNESRRVVSEVESLRAENTQLRAERDRLLIRVREYAEAMSNAMQTVFVVCPICGAMKEREIICWRCDDDPDYAALTQREGGEDE